jgi:hypothetical protein
MVIAFIVIGYLLLGAIVIGLLGLDFDHIETVFQFALWPLTLATATGRGVRSFWLDPPDAVIARNLELREALDQAKEAIDTMQVEINTLRAERRGHR